jgi:hypothetical protein
MRTSAPLLSVICALAVLAGCRGKSKAPVAPAPANPAAPKLAISAVEPGSATPGSAITVRGSQFAPEVRVFFPDGQIARVSWIDAATLKVWVPAGARSGDLRVEYPGGGASAPFTVLPARAAALDLPFVQVPDSNDGKTCKLDFPGPRRTRQYEPLCFPKAPIFHPYHPLDQNDGSLRPGKLLCQVSLNLQLPKAFFPALPASIQTRLAELKLGPDQVDLLVVSQDQPWMGPMLFRPHYWTDPEAPATGTYDQRHRVQAGIFEAEPGIQFVGHTPGEWVEGEVIVHPGGDWIVSSPNNLAVSGLNEFHSRSFWTLVQCGDRAAATLHLMLSDGDQAHLEALTLKIGTLRELVQQVEHSALADTPMAASLKALTRPLVTSSLVVAAKPRVQHPGRSGAPSKPRPCIYELLGNGFTGTRAVTLGGKDVNRFRVIDDTRLKVILHDPAGDGELVVTTPLGASAPVKLAQVLP